MDLRDGTTVYGRFAATTTVGLTTAEHVSISSSGILVKDNSTVLSSFGSTVTVGQTGAGKSYLYIDASGNLSITNNTTEVITLSSSGDATFTGTVYATAGSFAGNVSASSGNIGG